MRWHLFCQNISKQKAVRKNCFLFCNKNAEEHLGIFMYSING